MLSVDKTDYKMSQTLKSRVTERRILPLPPLPFYDIVFQVLRKNDIEIIPGKSTEPIPARGSYLRSVSEIVISYDGSLDTLSAILAENPHIGKSARKDEEFLFYDNQADSRHYRDRVIVSLKPIFGR